MFEAVAVSVSFCRHKKSTKINDLFNMCFAQYALFLFSVHIEEIQQQERLGALRAQSSSLAAIQQHPMAPIQAQGAQQLLPVAATTRAVII